MSAPTALAPSGQEAPRETGEPTAWHALEPSLALGLAGAGEGGLAASRPKGDEPLKLLWRQLNSHADAPQVARFQIAFTRLAAVLVLLALICC